MNDIQVTIRGNVASEPRMVRFDDGNVVTGFRLASNARRFDAERSEWVTTATTYVTVNCRRALARNAAECVRKGEPVLVVGRLRERIWEKDGRAGRSIEVEADGLGHDLAWGTSAFVRVLQADRPAPLTSVPFEPSVVGPDEPDAAQGAAPGEALEPARDEWGEPHAEAV